MDKGPISVESKTETLEKLINLCHEHLFMPDGEQVLSYLLNSRKLSEDTIRKFKLGYFPNYTDTVADKIGSYVAWKLGIVGFNSNNDIVSKFTTHNVLIPIFNEKQVPVAVIGRSLLSETARQKLGLPKYINSYFKKSSNLFGLNLSKDVIRSKNEIILAEGNFDVITAHQNGLENIVAISNSNISRTQILLAARYTNNIKLMLDNDEAGQLGIKRAMEAFKDQSGIKLSQLPLPSDAKDIDDFFNKGYNVSELYK